MGNLFSKEKRHRPHTNGYASIPAPAVDSGRYSQHPSYSHKIDPRDERQQQYSQHLSSQAQGQYIQPKPANTKILPEYRLHLTCLDCAQRNKACPVIGDLNVNKLDPRRRYAYRDPSNAGGARRWTLAIDFCGFTSMGAKRDAAEEVLRRFCGGADRAFDDVGMGSTYGAQGLRGSHGFFGRGKATAAPQGPFEVDELLRALSKRGVKYESSV